MNGREFFLDTVRKMGLEAVASADLFFEYKKMLLEWNEKINLTAITDEREIIIKHFADSLSIVSNFEIAPGASVIDVGTGAGFPGIPVKLARPDISMTLVDSLNKRVKFLEEVVASLHIEGTKAVHMRAEDGGQNPAFREKFDCCISRAVANLAVLSEYCLPFVKVGGVFVSLKGPKVEEEMAEGKKALDVLGGKVKEIIPVSIPNSDIKHSLVIISKIKHTPPRYPRKAGTAAKSPIK